jgi:nucleoside-diphosphate-sugar epimerase
MGVMKILLTGATGLIGSSVLTALLAHGHEVVAIVRSDSSAKRASDAGATAVVGDISDATWFAEQLRGVDGAIHTASPGDETSATVDAAVVDAVIDAFGDTPKPYVHTGGIWVHGSGADLTEETPFAAPAIVAWRAAVEERLLASGVHASIVEPAIVYGHGQGIPGVLAAAPRTDDGRLTVLGDGTQHWATVHVDDLAELYVRVLEGAEVAGRVIGASGQNPTVRELAEALAGGEVVDEGADASLERLGAFGEALLLDQQASGAKARSLGWEPSRPSLLDEVRAGRYAV